MKSPAAFDFRPEDFGELSAQSKQGVKMRLFHWDGEKLTEGTADEVDTLLNGEPPFLTLLG